MKDSETSGRSPVFVRAMAALASALSFLRAAAGAPLGRLEVVVNAWPRLSVLTALALGLVWPLWSGPDLICREYCGLANDFIARGVFGVEGRLVLDRAQFYPGFLALVKFVSESAYAFFVAQAGLRLLLLVLVYRLGCRLHSHFCGFLSALLTACFPLQANAMEVEFFYSLILACVALLLVELDGSARRMLGLAAVLGVSLSCRSTLFLFPLFLPVWLYLRRPLAATFPAGRLLLLLAAFVLVAPWSLRNWHYTSRFVPFEDPAVPGRNFYLASLGYSAWWDKSDDAVYTLARARHPELSEARSAEEAGRLLPRLAISNIAQAPGRYLASSLRRLLVWFSYEKTIFFLAACGLVLGWRRDKVFLLASLPVYFTLVQLPLTTMSRFVIPLVPLLCALAGYFFAALQAGETAPQGAVGMPALSGPAPQRLALGLLAFVYLWSTSLLAVEWLVLAQRGGPGGLAERFVSVTAFERGTEALFKRDNEGAIRHFSLAIHENPGQAAAYQNRGFAWAEKGDWRRALADYESALRLEPGPGDLHDAIISSMVEARRQLAEPAAGGRSGSKRP